MVHVARRSRSPRLESLPEVRTDWLEVHPGRGKGDDIHFRPWYCYLDERKPDYPRRILEAQYAEVLRRMDLIRDDHADPETVDVHHWQNHNPVHTKGLLKLTSGGRQVVYHGGLLHVALRHFDADRRRPGLPEDVVALVTALGRRSVAFTLVNTSTVHRRSVNGRGTGTTPWLRVELPPGRSTAVRAGMKRCCNAPSYRRPWEQ